MGGDTADKGEPCFIASREDTGIKPDYVFGRGPRGFGYYHMMTRNAYENLYSRLAIEAPVACCCAFSKAKRQEAYDRDDVKQLMYNRSIARRPDDEISAQAY